MKNSTLKVLAIWITTLPICLNHVLAQKIHADTTLAGRYLKLSDSLELNASYDSALYYSDFASRLYEKHQIWHGHIEGLNKSGTSLIHQGKYDQALNLLEKALKLGLQYFGKNHILVGDSFGRIGVAWDLKGYYEKATDYQNKALKIKIAHYGEMHSEVANTYLNLGILAHFQGDNWKAIKNYQKALKIGLATLDENDPIIIHCYNNLGLSFKNLGDYQQSLSLLQKSLQIRTKILDSNHPDLGRVLNNIGTVYTAKGEDDKAIKFYQKSLKIKIESLGESHPEVVNSISNLGLAYSYKAEYDKAIEFYLKALKIRQSSLRSGHPLIGLSYQQLGSAWLKQGENEKAIEWLRKALQVRINNLEVDHPRLADIYSDLGLAYSDLGLVSGSSHHHQEAHENHLKALEIRLNSFGKNHPEVAYSYGNLGLFYQNLGKLEMAVEHYKHALKIRLTRKDLKHPSTALYYNKLGTIYRLQGKYDEAISTHQKALQATCDFSLSDKFSNPPLNKINLPLETVEVLKAKGETLYQSFLFNPLKPKKESIDIKVALSTLQLAIELIDKVRIGYHLEKSRQGFSENYADVFQLAFRISTKLYQMTGDQSYLIQAWEIAEKSKSFTLNQTLREKHITSSFSLPDSLVEKEKFLKNEIAFYKQDIFERTHQKEGFDTTLVTEFENRLFNREREFEALRDKFEQNYPKYHQLKYSTAPVSVQTVQENLEDDQALIEYFWGETTLYSLTVTSQSLQVYSVPLDSNLVSSISSLYGLYNELQHSNEDTHQHFLDLSTSIYNKVLNGPISHFSSRIKNLIVVSDGLLSNINFDLLLYTDTKIENSWKHHPYLLKKMAITTAYSATLLFDQEHRPTSPPKDLLAFSFGKANNNGRKISMTQLRSTTTQELPGSLEEIKSIANLVEGEYFFGKSANESQFKAIASDFRILHLAIHGEIDDLRPENSRLSFFSEEDTLDDGSLYAHEIYNLELSADLAVLSACNTGTGKVLAGEGVMSLGRAFSYAGVNSLLLTRWNVSDAVAPKIMEAFYQGLKNGKKKSESLQAAKIEFLDQANEIESNPFFWGSFYMMGDDSPVDFLSSNKSRYAISILIGALFFLLLFIGRKFIAKTNFH